MRLPADATLLVLGPPGENADADAEAMAARLIEAWRREGLPAIDMRGDPDDVAEAFAGGQLEERLDDFGATTLVLCGREAAVGACARDAAARGFHAFVVVDACWRSGETTTATAPWREDAIAVDGATALAAAALAKARQRREAGRRRSLRISEADD